MFDVERRDSMPVSWLFWALGGAAIGAALGILFAPQSGVETREDIEEWGRKKSERGRELAAKIRDAIPGRVKVEAAVGAVKGAAHGAYENAKSKIDDSLS